MKTREMTRRIVALLDTAASRRANATREAPNVREFMRHFTAEAVSTYLTDAERAELRGTMRTLIKAKR